MIMRYSWFVLVVVMVFLSGCGGDSSDSSREDSSFFMGRGEKELAEGRYSQSLSSFEKAVEMDPDLIAGHEKLALIYDGLYGDIEKARHYYSRCIELEKNKVKKNQFQQWMDGLDKRDQSDWQQIRPAPEGKPGDLQQARTNLKIQQDEELINDSVALRSKLERKSRELDKTKNKINEQDQKIASLAIETKNRKTELLQLRKKSKEMEQANIKLQTQLDQVRKEAIGDTSANELKNRLIKAISINRNLLKHYQDTKTKLAEATERIELYRTREQKFVQTIKKQRSQLAQLRETKQSPPLYTTYIVQQGDTFRKIAKAKYGNPGKWQIIYDANRDRVENQNVIKMGTELKIPVLQTIPSSKK